MRGCIVIGVCSRCGGDVVTPGIWHGLFPPTPSCRSCGGYAKAAQRTVIDVEPVVPSAATPMDVHRAQFTLALIKGLV